MSRLLTLGVGGAGIAATVYPLDGLTATAAWSMTRALYAAYEGSSLYTDAGSGAISNLEDQTGNNRDIAQGTSSKRPTASTGGPNSRACADFDGSNDSLGGAALSNFITNSAGYVIVSVMFDAITLLNAQAYQDHAVIAETLGYFGIIASNTAGSPETARAYNYDGTQDYAIEASIVIDTPYVLEWRHESGNLYLRVNGGSWSAATASGNTQVLTGTISIGSGFGGVGYLDGKIFEGATFSTIPSGAEQDTLCAEFMSWIGGV